MTGFGPLPSDAIARAGRLLAESASVIADLGRGDLDPVVRSASAIVTSIGRGAGAGVRQRRQRGRVAAFRRGAGGPVDQAIVDLSPEKKIARAQQIEAICRADKRIQKSYGANFTTNVGATILANSNGTSASFTKTTCSCGVYLQAGSGDNLIDEGKYDYACRLGGLMSPEDLAREAIHRVTRLIGARKVPTQEVPVVLEPEMSSELLQFFFNCVQGSSVYRKQTFLADKIGEKVAHERVSIVDDGLMPGVPGATPFDREGVPTRRTPNIEPARSKHHVPNCPSARRIGLGRIR